MQRKFFSCLAAWFALMLVVATPSISAESEEGGEWISLFNGKDLSGWNVVLTEDLKGIDPKEVFQVEDGVIHVYRDVAQGAETPIGYLASDDEYSWYRLKLEFRWGTKRFAPRTARVRDAGLLYHASGEKRVWPRSVECQIQERDVGDCFTVRGVQVTTTVDPKRLKSGIYKYLPAAAGGVPEVRGSAKIDRVVKQSNHEVDGWNTVEVIVRGDEEVVHKVNGHEVFRATQLKQLDENMQDWIPLKKGRILLQAEFAEVFYRNIMIQPIEGGPLKVSNLGTAGQ